ncbi:unnamed protein product [Rotaria sp. Silwood1]|nr:unnamed protein product [Rotaria sp. Silwood1]CAF1635338.1 unnamed protein product [Rotaria sp. Silwood1]CAF3779396.1 unnamed protein product [Rotaria sp. Silwood1]CAF3811863.1 unnamed protein product [Rotaria sp. Silwood1]CAF3824077.1 unnamed protein product [Rotaria sp. Silwood1]
MDQVYTFILRKCKIYKRSFGVLIRVEDKQFVTLDDDYLIDFKPFIPKGDSSTDAQPFDLSNKVILQVILKDYVLHSTSGQELLAAGEGIRTQNNEYTRKINTSVPVSESQQLKSLTLSNPPHMGFTRDVNKQQKNQYISDNIIRIQGKKDPTKDSVLPRFQIWYKQFKEDNVRDWTLIAYIVLDEYKSGKRTLYKDSLRAFVKKEKIDKYLDEYEIPIEGEDWISKSESNLELCVVAKKEAKLKRNRGKVIPLCEIKNSDTSQGAQSSIDSIKSRLAIVLKKGSDIQWETLVLSNEMVFTRKSEISCVSNILKIPKKVSTSSKQLQSMKRHQMASNTKPKGTKKAKIQTHASTENLMINNNDSAMHVNGDLVACDNTTSIIMDITPQPMPNNSSSDPQLLLDDLLNTDFSAVHSINMLDFDLDLDTNNIMTSNDPRLSDAATFDPSSYF